MERVLVDSGTVFALLCRDDQNHRAAVAGLRKMQRQRALPVLTNYLLAETHALLAARLGPDAARMWVRSNIWPVEQAGALDEKRAMEILLSGRGGDCTLVDAISFAVMERLGMDTVFTFDKNFAQYGFKMAETA
ncbi:type II toxin-antitoxin system VapC family toxin [Desulfoscipio gibsoniae]|uniref:Putative nucleic acid-binding protein, contains PIN domain n=1 Tax=Desulfoscipio gibsoniae DSM 7213 TaxID=767817 RepID=R4KLM1_9FIRM|nr:PIN domain-containing protein [Desulfoscipio gibsoniae]AGL03559.1 putative nucleic acid-binding protein, contains PIN domain [Desulfoscipio gibsoniae DSM 7213]